MEVHKKVGRVMAKKKKRKNSDEKKMGYSVELTGLIIVLIGIIGFGFGLVGALFKKFSIFLVGEFWYLLLILLIMCINCLLYILFFLLLYYIHNLYIHLLFAYVQ